MALNKSLEEMDQLIGKMEQRILLFETYIYQNNLEADFERFCEEQKKALENKQREKYPTKEQIPR